MSEGHFEEFLVYLRILFKWFFDSFLSLLLNPSAKSFQVRDLSIDMYTDSSELILNSFELSE
jgi:hypothetical protein